MRPEFGDTNLKRQMKKKYGLNLYNSWAKKLKCPTCRNGPVGRHRFNVETQELNLIFGCRKNAPCHGRKYYYDIKGNFKRYEEKKENKQEEFNLLNAPKGNETNY